MRRLLLLGMALLLLGLTWAAAAALEVEGGVLQSFRLDVVIDVPEPRIGETAPYVTDAETTVTTVPQTP